MIPPDRQQCVSRAAGPLRFEVEVRHLDDRAVATSRGEEMSSNSKQIFDDYGATLHVFGATDGIEHLRFDCFAKKPHYHYAQESGNVNLVCRLDQYAEGDPVEWTIDRLRCRLPEMLEHCRAFDLAQLVRDRSNEILAVIDEVAELLREAQKRATAVHAV